MSQHMHIQNHAYANESWHTYVCDVCKLSNPEYLISISQNLNLIKIQRQKFPQHFS